MHDSSMNDGPPPTSQRLRASLRGLGRQSLALVRTAARHVGPLLRLAWQTVRPVLRTLLQIVLALLILLEEWGWRPLADLLGRLARWQPWARIETAIARLPPYAALLVFVVPTALLLPLKFLALVLIANGQIVLAGLLFAAAKVVATALVARLFMLTQPALMQIGWFAWGYETLMPWKEALVERVRASWVWRTGRIWKERGKRVAAAQWRAWRPAVLQLLRSAKVAGERAAAYARRLFEHVKAP
jgi:hypothetical protein